MASPVGAGAVWEYEPPARQFATRATVSGVNGVLETAVFPPGVSPSFSGLAPGLYEFSVVPQLGTPESMGLSTWFQTGPDGRAMGVQPSAVTAEAVSGAFWVLDDGQVQFDVTPPGLNDGRSGLLIAEPAGIEQSGVAEVLEKIDLENGR